jgi:hypothetical protein
MTLILMITILAAVSALLLRVVVRGPGQRS